MDISAVHINNGHLLKYSSYALNVIVTQRNRITSCSSLFVIRETNLTNVIASLTSLATFDNRDSVSKTRVGLNDSEH